MSPAQRTNSTRQQFSAAARALVNGAGEKSSMLGSHRHAFVGRVAIIAALLGSLFASLTSPAAEAERDTRPILAVGNSYDGTVNFIDARRLRRIGPPLNVIPDGATPQDPKQAAAYNFIISVRGEHNFAQEVDFSPNGKILYVSRGYLGDIAAFSVARRTMLWRLQLPSLRADHLTVSPDGSTIFATSLPGNQVYAISAATHQIIGSYEAGTYPHVLEFSPNGRYLYSGTLGNQLAPYGQDNGVHELAVADPRTLQVVRTYSFQAGVRPFAFSENGRSLVLQLSYFNGFEVLNLQSGEVVRTVNLPLLGPGLALVPADYPNAAAHHGIDVSGPTVCDAGTISNYVALVVLRTGKVRKIIHVGQAPGEALTSLDGRYCFVTDRGPTGLDPAPVPKSQGDSVSVIDYRTGRVRTIAVGRHPQSEATAKIPAAVLRRGGFLHGRRGSG
jgi:DNA-binding beta-propeller fold protein YncE